MISRVKIYGEYKHDASNKIKDAEVFLFRT